MNSGCNPNDGEHSYLGMGHMRDRIGLTVEQGFDALVHWSIGAFPDFPLSSIWLVDVHCGMMWNDMYTAIVVSPNHFPATSMGKQNDARSTSQSQVSVRLLMPLSEPLDQPVQKTSSTCRSKQYFA